MDILEIFHDAIQPLFEHIFDIFVDIFYIHYSIIGIFMGLYSIIINKEKFMIPYPKERNLLIPFYVNVFLQKIYDFIQR